jgi:uncharacterized repeat protein (TIGR02543 family)
VGEETPTVYPAVYTFTTEVVVQLTAVPKQGYVFTGWKESSAETTPTISITMTCTKRLIANFAPIRYHVSASASIPAMGEVALDPSQPDDGYVIGTRVYLRATPAKGYVFKEWTGGASGTDAVTSIIVDASKTVTAVFEVKRSATTGWVWGGTGAGVIAIGLAVYWVRFRKK